MTASSDGAPVVVTYSVVSLIYFTGMAVDIPWLATARYVMGSMTRNGFRGPSR
ncbi:MAG: hypothetical protein LC793_18455 [Thermomicrobia bacterium]|nr:hypothetical protein [Thermomicrobia bacterium]